MLKYDKHRKKLVNIAVDDRSSPFYALRDRQGNAIGVTACDIDGDGREEIYVLNTNNAFSGKCIQNSPTQWLFFIIYKPKGEYFSSYLGLSYRRRHQITDTTSATINHVENYREQTLLRPLQTIISYFLELSLVQNDVPDLHNYRGYRVW